MEEPRTRRKKRQIKNIVNRFVCGKPCCNKIAVTKKGMRAKWGRNSVSLWNQSSRFRSKGLWRRGHVWSCITQWWTGWGFCLDFSPWVLSESKQHATETVPGPECAAERGRDGCVRRQAGGRQGWGRRWKGMPKSEYSSKASEGKRVKWGLENDHLSALGLPRSAGSNHTSPKAQQGLLTEVSPVSHHLPRSGHT